LFNGRLTFAVTGTRGMEPRTLTDSHMNQTTVHPVALAVVCVLGLLTIMLPRRYAIFPMIALACFIPSAQRVVIFSLDFTFLRLMVLAGWVRVLARGELVGTRRITLDWLVIAWAAVGTIAYTIQRGNPEALVFKLGTSFDAIGSYFLFRCLIRSFEDLDVAIVGLTLVSAPTAAAFAIEHFTAHNIFSMFGGVPETTAIREGRLRCQGAFSHPILAGCFWASMIPLIAARWGRGQSARLAVVAGVACCGAIIVACSSSTPVAATFIAALGGALYLLRNHMRWVRWSAVGLLILLQLMMSKPVWHLMARVNIVAGSTGRHRFRLIDNAIAHFPEWCLVGTRSTGHWGTQLFDVTNQYLLEGLRGGFLTLVLFVSIIVVAFRGVGRAVKLAGTDRAKSIAAWLCGVSLLVHCMSFLAVSYSGQIYLAWYLTLAIIGSLSSITPRQVTGASGARRRDRRLSRTPSATAAAVPAARGATWHNSGRRVAEA
jgi:hypothetical protein